MLFRSVEPQGDGEAQDGSIVLRNLTSGVEKELYRDANLLARPFSVSPDGRHLVCAVMEEAGARLMVLDVATRDVHELTHVDGLFDIESVVWSTDGKHLLYVEFGDRATTIWRAPVGGGEPKKLLESFPFQGAVSPDATHIAYTVGRHSERYMVMENIKAVLKDKN